MLLHRLHMQSSSAHLYQLMPPVAACGSVSRFKLASISCLHFGSVSLGGTKTGPSGLMKVASAAGLDWNISMYLQAWAEQSVHSAFHLQHS